MKRLIYGSFAVQVADDLAEWVSVASTEFACAGRAIAVPVSGFDISGDPEERQLVVGVGIPLAIMDAEPHEEGPNTLRCIAWIRDEVESLQQELAGPDE
ncbi:MULTISPECIES: hypothetical protein [unclassified Curtobacterium]|uniref:hypothetical protein n=1 Tax=unclassified Curtobacterium TaxID=257496 RepID=UPI003A807F75